MSSLITTPIQKLAHFAIDLTIPRNDLIFFTAGSVGGYVYTAFHNTLKVRLTHNLCIFRDTYLKSPFVSEEGRSYLQWGADFTSGVLSDNVIAFIVNNVEIATAIATSITLNIIFDSVFKIKSLKEAYQQPKPQPKIPTRLLPLPPINLQPPPSVFHRPPNIQDLATLENHSQPPTYPNPPLKIAEPSIPVAPLEPPKNMPEPTPSLKPAAQTPKDDIKNILDELDDPCCGNFPRFLKIWA